MSDRSQPVEQWARTVHLSEPIRWAAVEDEVLARRPPRPVDETTADRVIRRVGFVLMAILAIPSIGSSIVGLVLYMAGAHPVVVRIFFLLAIGVAVSMLLIWWEDRDRGPVKLLVTAGSGGVSLAAYLIMRSAPAADRDAWAALFMLAAAAAGLLVFGVILALSKSADVRPSPRIGSLNPAKGTGYMQARKRVLGILVERGVVDLAPDTQKKMTEMPLGTWTELDEASSRDIQR